jgi:hypothetical protein
MTPHTNEAGGVLGVLADWANDTTCALDEANRRAATYATIAELVEAAIDACLRPHDGARSYCKQMNRLHAAIHAMQPDGIDGPFAHGVPESLDDALRAVGAKP